MTHTQKNQTKYDSKRKKSLTKDWLHRWKYEYKDGSKIGSGRVKKKKKKRRNKTKKPVYPSSPKVIW